MDRFNQDSSWQETHQPSLRVARSSSDYLLDTNACIALDQWNPPSVRAKFRKATDLGGQVFVSPSLCSTLYGVAKSSRRDFNKKRLETFFAGPIHPLSFEDQDAEIAGVIRADLESIGKPIGGLMTSDVAGAMSSSPAKQSSDIDYSQISQICFEQDAERLQ